MLECVLDIPYLVRIEFDFMPAPPLVNGQALMQSPDADCALFAGSIGLHNCVLDWFAPTNCNLCIYIQTLPYEPELYMDDGRLPNLT